jgi:hypothetical protein
MAIKSSLLNRRLWSPVELSPQLWLDAADEATITLNANKVVEWRDKSGNNLHASQSVDGNRPTFSNNNIVFDGSNQWLARSTALNDIVSMACIIRNRRSTGGANIISTNNSSNGLCFLFGVVGGRHYRCAGSGTNMVMYGHTPDASNFDICVANKQTLFRRTGTQLNSIGNNNLAQFSSNLEIGRRVTNLYFLGDIAEIILFANTMTLTQRERLEGYLAFKWNRQNGLPSNHPYKNTCPFI